MKAVILATAMAVGFASYASAAEVKKDTKKAPVVAGKTMTDTQMDKVTAGSGEGIGTALNNTAAVGHAGFGISTAPVPFASPVGFGTCTAGLTGC